MHANAGSFRLSLSLPLSFSLLALAPLACFSNDHLLVGDNGNDGGSGGSGGGTGGAMAPTPTINRLQHPLPIAAPEALTRMANLIWNAPPDADLLSQAAAGHFVTIEDLYGPARQLLADPRAAKGVGAFYDWWLQLPEIDGLTKDPALFPTFTAQLAADMHQEVLAFARFVTLEMNGTFGTLLTAPFSLVNARLADVYGLNGVTGDDLRQVALNPAERAGLLTMPGLQAQSSQPNGNDPPYRGTTISERLLCSPIPPPPGGFLFALSPVPSGTTARQALAMQVARPECASCHQLIDPPGLAFETFDAIGRTRTTDNGAPVDVSNLQVRIGNGVVTINGGPVELAKVLARSAQSQECMARQWLAFALKRDPTINAQGSQFLSDAVVAQALQPFQASGFNLKELIAAVLLTDAFLAP